jgi:hypothetical protein
VIRLSTRASAAVAAAVAVGVLAATLAVLGDGFEGAAAAARSTARWSCVVMAWAVSGRAVLETHVRRAWAFVAAHLVHYGAVMNYAVVEPRHGLHGLAPAASVQALGGVVLVVLVGVTSGAARGSGRARVNTASFYVAWAALLAASAAHVTKYVASAVSVAVLLAGMGARARIVAARRT